MPFGAFLDGTVTDDGIPDPPGAITATWSLVAGPGIVTLPNPFAIDTVAGFSVPGIYVLRLTANDSALTSSADVTITVNPAVAVNQPPIVSAGPDRALALPAFALLDGTVADDGLPIPPGVVTVSWTMVSGPGTVLFSDPSAADTAVSFSGAGTFVLRLTASDSILGAFDDVTVTVTEAPLFNQPPAVNAGPDLTVTLPASALLDGTVVDDQLPDPPSLTSVWTVVSAPGLVAFGNPLAVDTTASFTTPGAYILRLTASDGALSSSDEVRVTVTAANTAPRVNAGSDQGITLPAIATVNGAIADDGLPVPPGTLTTFWSLEAGTRPGDVRNPGRAQHDGELLAGGQLRPATHRKRRRAERLRRGHRDGDVAQSASDRERRRGSDDYAPARGESPRHRERRRLAEPALDCPAVVVGRDRPGHGHVRQRGLRPGPRRPSRRREPTSCA